MNPIVHSDFAGTETMTEIEKIQIAADLIGKEMADRGIVIGIVECHELARRLHAIWTERDILLNLAPGEIAQRLRERIIYDAREINKLWENE